MKKVIIAILLLFNPFAVWANHVDVRNYNVQEGLIQSQVFDIVQDQDGFLWFATAGGISRFDGHEFLNFTRRQGLPENYTTAALIDQHGNLWFAHLKGKLSKINPQTFAIESFQIQMHNKPQNNFQIYKLFQDSTGRIWIITVGRGLFYFQNGQFYNLSENDGLLSSYIYDLMQYNDSTLWVATPRGLSTINLADSSLGKIDSLAIFDLKSPYIIDMEKDTEGNVWFSILNKGLYCLTKEGKEKKITQKDGLLENNIWNISITEDQILWLSYNLKGLSCIDLKNSTPEKYKIEHFTPDDKLTSGDIFKIFIDREKNVWLGLNGKGVDQLRESLMQLYRFAVKNAPENIVWSIWGQGENFWFGLENGIAHLNLKTSQKQIFKTVGKKSLQSVMQILPDRQGNVWFVSYGSGIFKYDLKLGRLSEFKIPDTIDEHFAFCMAQDNNEKLWFGFEDYGLLIYDPKAKKFEHLTREKNHSLSDSIAVIFNANDGNIWIGTFDAGLIRYDGKEFKKYAPDSGFPIHGVNAIAKGPDGRLWLISTNDELLAFDGQSVEVMTNQLGLSQNSLYSMQFWKNQLWIGTNRGLLCIDLKNGNRYDIGWNSGFAVFEANEKAAFLASDSSLWFGTIDGAVRINPRVLQNYQLKPVVKLGDVQLFSQPFKWPKNNKLSNVQNHLTFNFTGLFFKVPEWLKFQYRLKGFEARWSLPTTTRSAQYSYIPPGAYTFQVRASIDGVNWTEPKELSFVITPPFYKTWWFMLFSSVLILSIILGTIYYRDKKSKQIQLYLEQKVNERTNELQQEKDHVEAINKALRESEAKFRTLTEISPSAIFIYQDFKFVYVNPATEKITGYSKEELIHKPILEVIHPDFQSLVAERAKKRMEGEIVPDRYEFKIIRKNGEERWVDFSARAIQYLDREAGLGTVFDITERKLAEEALMEEKERLAATMSAIADGVIATDREQRIILCNKRALQIIGLPEINESNYFGKRVSDLINLANEDTDELLPNPVEELIQSQGSHQIEGTGYLLVRDKKILVEYSAAPIFDKDSKIMGVVVAFRDISEKRRMEKELLKNQKLESIGVLAGGIAHDFNNFLTAIMGNLSLMRMRIKEDDKRLINRIKSAEKAAEKAQELTQQLLTFSKGGVPIKKTTDIYELVKDSVEFVLSGSNVDYVLESESGLWNAVVDPGQINQVVQNLVINANQAMPNGGTIYIKLENLEIKKDSKLPLNEGKYIKLKVKDQGVGIPPKYLAKIFDPFFSTKQSGSGLGLATSFSIIKKHNGHIEVQSKVGQGTEFTIYLPATTEVLKTIQQDFKLKKFKNGNSKPVVLVMDDEEMVRDLAANLFDQLGFVVLQAKDGQEALNLYEAFLNDSRKIDLVVMDLTIPGGMGGKEAIEKLLLLDQDANVIVSSGYSNDPVMAEYDKYGFKACLKKPFKLEELVTVLKEVMETEVVQ